MGKTLLKERPEDAGARQQFIELIGELRKANRAREAKECCRWAQGAVKDAAVQTALLLQEAIITATDEKNPALAVKMCDEVASRPGVSAEQAGTARWLAGKFLVAGKNPQEAIRRAQETMNDPAAAIKNKAQAAGLLIAAWADAGKPEKGIEAAMAFVKGLSEPEPAEAAECRQALCMALLGAQRIEEAVAQCKVLMARHPDSAAAHAMEPVLENLSKETGRASK